MHAALWVIGVYKHVIYLFLISSGNISSLNDVLATNKYYGTTDVTARYSYTNNLDSAFVISLPSYVVHCFHKHLHVNELGVRIPYVKMSN